MNGLKLLLWKNFKILSRDRSSLALSILFPVFCITVFAILRCAVKQTKYPEATIYPAFSPREIPPVVQNITKYVYYAPSNSITDSIMQTVLDNAFNSRGLDYKFMAFPSEGKLIEAYKQQGEDPQNTNQVLAGVIFENLSSEEIPSVIEYTLKFPGAQRTKYSLLWDQLQGRPDWLTQDSWPYQEFGGPRSRESKYGGYPGYFEEGYLYLQYAINEAISTALLDPAQLSYWGQFDLNLQRFPAPPFTVDKFSYLIQLFMSLTVAISFAYSVVDLTRRIIHEKSSKLKEFMNIMGLANWQHWLAWFISSYLTLLFITILVVLILKIKIHNDVAVLTHSEPSVVYFVFAIYALNVISFSFLFSTVFENEAVGSLTAMFVWIVSAVPAFAYVFKIFKMTFWEKTLSCFFIPNTPNFYIINFLHIYEGFGVGLQWDNLWQGLTQTDDFSVGTCLVMSLVNSFVHVLSALYIELAFPGKYGVPLPWYFPFTCWFWMGLRPKTKVNFENGHDCRAGAFEMEPNLEAGIVIENLTKRYESNKVSLKNLTMKMYQDQVTSLLGPNGAGKTTTMSILTGFIRASAGNAWVNSYNVESETAEVRRIVGLCPQYSILFDNLTVEEHFKFYCQLKGLNEADTFTEMERWINTLGLQDKRKVWSKHLSGGMQRKLCVGMSFSAGSKVVFLDEPTAGMDPEARRATWDLIQSEKLGRTVILSTQYMEEADALGDRIAIMAQGELLCCGSSLYLKSTYGGAFDLMIVKKEGMDSQAIKTVVSSVMSEAVITSNTSTEISCALPSKDIPLFPRLFQELETHKEELGVVTYAAESVSMEQVFVRVVTGRSNEGEVETLNQTNDPTSQLHTDTNNQKRNGGIKLLFLQFLALAIKKLLISCRKLSISFLQIIIPTMAVLEIYRASKFFPGVKTQTKQLNTMKQLFKNMGESTALFNCKPDSALCTAINSTLQPYSIPGTVEDVSMGASLMALISNFKYQDVSKYMLAFQEEFNLGGNRTELTIFFNNQPYHVPPVALNVFFNGMLQLHGLNSTIMSKNEPFEYTSVEEFRSNSHVSIPFTLGFSVCYALVFLSSVIAIPCLSEQVSKFKRLQIIAGVKLTLYWFVDFLCNMISVMIFYGGLLATIVIYNIHLYDSWEVRRVLLVGMLCYGYYTISFAMLLSTVVNDVAKGFSLLFALHAVGVLGYLAYGLTRSPELGMEDVIETTKDVFSYLPSYDYTMLILSVGNFRMLKSYCSRFDYFYHELHNRPSECSSADLSYYSWEEPGIAKNLARMVGLGSLSLVVLVLVENKLLWKLRYLCSWTKILPKHQNPDSTTGNNLAMQNADILEESSRINCSSLASLNRTDNLIVRSLTKTYGKQRAVDGLSFGVKKGEIFGLVGPNGAGKTSTLKMLTGDASITSGDAFIHFHSMKSSPRRARSYLGYCPQLDAYVDELTGKETLTMFARLRGIPEDKIEDMIMRTSESLLFQHRMNKTFGSLSGGDKRKLSTGVAILGDPSIVLLDEPTAGMDPVARRDVWHALAAVRNRGSSILLTSQNMEECETLCSTLGIMSKGRFKGIGSPQELKSRLCPGYKLVVHLPLDNEGGRARDGRFKRSLENSDSVQRFNDFLQSRIPGCSMSMKDSRTGFSEYLIPKESVKWKEIFTVLNESKERFQLESFSIGHVDLEQVYFNSCIDS